MNVYEARWLNAQRVARKIQSWLDKGFIVFDDQGERVRKVELTEDAVYACPFPETSRYWTTLFENNKDNDHGLHTTVREFNDQFDKWLVCKASTYNVLGRRRKQIEHDNVLFPLQGELK